jgi:hypothetical protein
VNLDASFQSQRATGSPGQLPNVCCPGCRELLTLKTPPSFPSETKARGGPAPSGLAAGSGGRFQQPLAEEWKRSAKRDSGAAGVDAL